MQPSWSVASTDGTEIAGYEFGGAGDVVLIAHATGLCGPVYAELAHELSSSFRVVALDFRGHGNSGRSSSYSWDHTAEDLNAVVSFLDCPRVHGFGHSMGGASLLLAQRNDPSAFASLFLYEPIVRLETQPPNEQVTNQNVLAQGARRRRDTFDSRAEVMFRYASKPPFNQVQAGALAAYVESGFREDEAGKVRLQCPPEVEASMFEFGRLSILQDAERLRAPTIVAVGRHREGINEAAMGEPLADALPNAALHRYEHLTHFGPLQDPWSLARDIARLARNEAVTGD